MKIQDIITLEKKYSKPCNNAYGWRVENKTQLKYEKKKGHFWLIPSHSENEGILLNNYEKDCVIAYLDNKYFIAFLIKIGGKDNFKGFIYFKDFLKRVMGSYTYEISKVWNKKQTLKAFEDDKENLKIVEDEEYNRFKKLIILESLEE